MSEEGAGTGRSVHVECGVYLEVELEVQVELQVKVQYEFEALRVEV